MVTNRPYHTEPLNITLSFRLCQGPSWTLQCSGWGCARQIRLVAMTARVSVSLETGRRFRLPGRRLWGWGGPPRTAAAETKWEGSRWGSGRGLGLPARAGRGRRSLGSPSRPAGEAWGLGRRASGGRHPSPGLDCGVTALR